MSCPRISMSAFLLFWALVAVSAQSYFPPNPCPESFRYGYDQAGNVMGLVTLPFDGTRALQLEINATAAGVKRQGNQKMKVVLLTSPEDIFNQNVLTVRYHVVFPTNIPTPKVTRISLNQREHCAGPADRVYAGGPPVTTLYARHDVTFDSSNRAAIETDALTDDLDNPSDNDQSEKRDDLNIFNVPPPHFNPDWMDKINWHADEEDQTENRHIVRPPPRRTTTRRPYPFRPSWSRQLIDPMLITDEYPYDLS